MLPSRCSVTGANTPGGPSKETLSCFLLARADLPWKTGKCTQIWWQMHARVSGVECSTITPGVPSPHYSEETNMLKHVRLNTRLRLSCCWSTINDTVTKAKCVCCSRINLLAHLSHWEELPHSRLRSWSLRWWIRRGPAELNRSQEDTAGCRACFLQLPLRSEDRKRQS